MAHDDNERDNNNYGNNSNTNEDPDYPPGMALEPVEYRGKFSGVTLENPVELPEVAPPENPVNFPEVAPPENEVDENVVPPLLPSYYDSNNESDDKY